MPNFFKNFPQTPYDFENNGNQRLVTDIFRSIRAYSNFDEFVGYTLYDIQDGERPDQVSQRLYDTPAYFYTFFMINETLSRGLIDWPKEYNELEEYIDLKYPKKVMTFYRSAEDDQLNDHYVYEQFIAGERFYDDSNRTTLLGRIQSIDTVMNRIYIEIEDNALLTADQIFTDRGEKTLVQNENYSWSIEDERRAAHHYTDADGDIVNRIFFTDSGEGLTEVLNEEYERDLNDDKRTMKVIKPDYINQFGKAYKELINA